MYHGYFDGACRNNPGKIGLGASIVADSGEEVCCAVSCRPHGTNNDAEYLSLILLLQKARQLKIEELICYGDSKLVINQVTRVFNASEKFHKYLTVIDDLACQFASIDFKWIKRTDNGRADELSKRGLEMEHKGKKASAGKQTNNVEKKESTSASVSVVKKKVATAPKVEMPRGPLPYSVTVLDGKSLLVVQGCDIAVVKLDSMSCSCAEFLSTKSCIHVRKVKDSMSKYSKKLTVSSADQNNHAIV